MYHGKCGLYLYEPACEAVALRICRFKIASVVARNSQHYKRFDSTFLLNVFQIWKETLTITLQYIVHALGWFVFTRHSMRVYLIVFKTLASVYHSSSHILDGGVFILCTVRIFSLSLFWDHIDLHCFTWFFKDSENTRSQGLWFTL